MKYTVDHVIRTYESVGMSDDPEQTCDFMETLIAAYKDSLIDIERAKHRPAETVEAVAWMDADGCLHTTLISAEFTGLPVTTLYKHPAPAQEQADAVSVPRETFDEAVLLISTLTDPNAKTPGRTDASRELLPKLRALLSDGAGGDKC